MKKVAVITFHRAHNFGSVLQTYALQECVKSLNGEYQKDIEYQVIDLFTEKQEQLYSVFKKNDCAKNIIKNILALRYRKELQKKHDKFDYFLEINFSLTQRYKNDEELNDNPPNADYYISGSDQIWNIRALDFSLSYYLDFVKNGKRISYSASFGPLEIDWNQYDENIISKCLKRYNSISVRENGSAENIQKLIGQSADIHVDPTLLLKKEQWRKIQSDATHDFGKYILLYCLEPSKKQLRLADAISGKLGLPIVVLKYNNKNDIFNSYIKKYDSGPEDFLAYIDHAALVLSSSFHGTVFSIIYHKPFYVFDGMKDNRISTMLTKMNMEERSLEDFEDTERVDLLPPDSEKIEEVLEHERERSRKYLRRVLEDDKKNSMD